MSGAAPAMRWADLVAREPAMAEAGRRLLTPGGDGVAIGFLATAADAGPHLAPVCPIFCGGDLYLSVNPQTPKCRDLDGNGRYVLHAFLGVNDAEFRMAGTAERVTDGDTRSRVVAAIPFRAFRASDPVFRLSIERAGHVYWERAGQPDTRAVRRLVKAAGR